MNVIKQFSFLLMVLLLGPVMMAQTEIGTCGFGTFDKTDFHQRLLRNKANADFSGSDRAVSYVPIKYHLVGKNNETGILNERHVIDNLHALNAAYEDVGFVFYLKDGLNYVYNDFVYDDPGGSQFSINLNKDNNAVNLFITNLATTPSGQSLGTTLGYFWPGVDVLVMRKDQVNSDVGTVGHETGHFFSLDHTHNGWDVQPWNAGMHGNPYTGLNTPSPNPSVKVELVDGSNCDTAGDFLCDTPADYNLGFGWSVGGDQCAPYTGGCLDRNNDLLDPDELNFMGYFIDCDEYIFSPQQIALMQEDFDNRPELINGGYVPNEETVADGGNLNYPIGNESTPAFTIVEFDWDNVSGATHYVFELDKTPSFGNNTIHTVVDKSELTLETNLLPNFSYYWRITPFNETKKGNTSGFEKFKTGTATEIQSIADINTWEIRPNPSPSNGKINLEISSIAGKQNVALRIFDLNGQVVHEQKVLTIAGSHNVTLDDLHLAEGFYIVDLQHQGERESKKLVIAQ